MSHITYPFSLEPGQPENIGQVQSNFDAVANVVNGNLDATNMANNAVIAANIADSNVTTPKIANQSVTGDKLSASTVTAIGANLGGLVRRGTAFSAGQVSTTHVTASGTSVSGVDLGGMAVQFTDVPANCMALVHMAANLGKDTTGGAAMAMLTINGNAHFFTTPSGGAQVWWGYGISSTQTWIYGGTYARMTELLPPDDIPTGTVTFNMIHSNSAGSGTIYFTNRRLSVVLLPL